MQRTPSARNSPGRITMSHMPDDPAGEHRRTTRVLGAYALLAWGLAVYGAARAPWMRDLYNHVYANARPGRPEGTAAFLFTFPGMLLAAYLFNRLAPDFILAQRGSEAGFKLALFAGKLIGAGLVLVQAYRVSVAVGAGSPA